MIPRARSGRTSLHASETPCGVIEVACVMRVVVHFSYLYSRRISAQLKESGPLLALYSLHTGQGCRCHPTRPDNLE